MLAMRGVILTYETVREWCLKFGQTYANDLRRRSPRPGDRWDLDEVLLKMNGRIHCLWRAVDQDGDVLDILVQNKRDKKAAKKFFRKLLIFASNAAYMLGDKVETVLHSYANLLDEDCEKRAQSWLSRTLKAEPQSANGNG